MKKLLFAVVCALSALSSKAQPDDKKKQDTLTIAPLPYDTATKKLMYTEVVQAPGLKKDAIYSRVREWVALNFKSAKNVLQMDDKEAGKIITKGLKQSEYTMRILGSEAHYPYDLHFTLNIAIKDEKFRVQVSDFVSEYPSSSLGKAPDVSGEIHLTYLQDANLKVKSGKKLGNNERKTFLVSQKILSDAYDLGQTEVFSIKKAVLQPTSTDF